MALGIKPINAINLKREGCCAQASCVILTTLCLLVNFKNIAKVYMRVRKRASPCSTTNNETALISTRWVQHDQHPHVSRFFWCLCYKLRPQKNFEVLTALRWLAWQVQQCMGEVGTTTAHLRPPHCSAGDRQQRFHLLSAPPHFSLSPYQLACEKTFAVKGAGVWMLCQLISKTK